MKNITYFLFLCLFCLYTLTVQAENRWKINSDGSISWRPEAGETHQDHIEMSGLKVSAVVRYGVSEKGEFTMNRSIVWPMLRTVPNNTHASLTRRFAWDIPAMISINGQHLQGEKVETVTLNGVITVNSLFRVNRGNISLTRILFPSTDKPAFCEKYILRNVNNHDVSVEIP